MPKLAVAIAVAALTGACRDQPPGQHPGPGGPPGAPGSPEDPIGSRVFPPEMVMQRSAAIGLTEEQRQAIISEAEAMQGRMVRMQLEMTTTGEALRAALDAQPADEAAVIAATRVMGLETEIKRSHLAMLVRIRNRLTPEQQAKLRALRNEQ